MLKPLMMLAAVGLGTTGFAEVKLETDGTEWKAVAPTYSVTSKRGYINSITVGGREFLAQEKIPSGSYLCAGATPALQEINLEQSNRISGSNSLGKLVYTFSDTAISFSCENRSAAELVYYFIINPEVKTVLINGAGAKDVPHVSTGSSFKWVQGSAALNFEADARIWGPWQSFQVWQLTLQAGETKTVEIVPEKLTGNATLKPQGVNTNQCAVFDYSAVGTSGQIPLCMVGDSITWAEKGDWWRKELLERLPNLAFIGTHSGMFGYSHAGEGGNSTGQVLARMAAIPDCPYYHLLIGTNNNNVKTADQIPAKSSQTADEIIQIVQGLLKKKGAEKVFLASILPCATDNPLRDQCNSATNTILRAKFDASFPKGKVVWVEYENPIRATSDWEKKILLHPNEEGYALIAGITSEAIRSALTINPAFTRPEKSGVRVVNLMGSDLVTVCPVIAGWYLFSCKLDGVTGQSPEMILESQSPGKDALREVIPIKGAPGETISAIFFTKYEGYGYRRDNLTLKTNGCSVSNVLLEKMRPSQQPSIYGKDSYIDSVSPLGKGELLEPSI